MSSATKSVQAKRRGFWASFGLALRIATGSLRLLRQYPKLAAPLVPISGLILALSIGLDYVETLFGVIVAFLAILVLAFGLMFSFAVSSQLLKQIHEGRSPSLIEALFSADTLRMLPSVIGLSIIWYTLVLILVIIESIIRALLSRFSENLADGVIRAIFGTVATALRLSGFMLIAIMTFEQIGLAPAFQRLRETVKAEPVVAIGGLALTKTVSALIGFALFILSEFADKVNLSGAASPIFIIVTGLGWILAIYLEQLFVTGLYLYYAKPDSRIVAILLRDFIGKELPAARQPDVAF